MTLMTVQTLPPRVAVLPQAIEVVVDEEDIALGQRRSGFGCPIARATRRTLVLMGWTPESVVIGSAHYGPATASIQFESARPFGMYQLDQAGSDFVTQYDCSGNPPPCTVTLRRLGE